MSILLYLFISGLLSYQQRSFLLEWREYIQSPSGRVRELRILSPKWNVSIKTLPTGLWEP